VIDPRIYRAGFLPALVCLVIVMFSVQPLPEPLESPVTTAGFEPGPAARAARQIAAAAPARTPGSADDAAAADIVADRLGAIEGGELSEQPFEGSFDGDEVELRNLILVLPGESEQQVVLLAPRDSAEGVGLASSAAATGALIEIAESFGGARHSKTLVFVSTTGASDGARGAGEFVDSYPDRDLVEAAIVLDTPASSEPEPPFVVPWSADDESTSIQLTLTAEQAVSEQTDDDAGKAPEGLFGGLARLALPSALGEQGVLIADGLDAVALSSTGERPLSPSRDGLDSLAIETMGEVGGAALALLVTLDAVTAPLEHGPSAYVSFSGNLISGWSIALLAIALVLPAALAAVDAMARAWRRGEGRPRDLLWALSRSLPFLGVLLLAYLLGVTGLAPRPGFPYDPGRYEVGWGSVAVLLCLILALVVTWITIKPMRLPGAARREGLASAIGVVICVCVALVWLFNPYMALLLVPSAHVWLAAIGSGGAARRAGIAVAVVLAVALPVIAAIDLAGRLEVGITLPWHLMLMVTGGQIPFAAAVLGCLIAGALVALVAAALAPEQGPGTPRLAARGRAEI